MFPNGVARSGRVEVERAVGDIDVNYRVYAYRKRNKRVGQIYVSINRRSPRSPAGTAAPSILKQYP
jgi:hypothetical protein